MPVKEDLSDIVEQLNWARNPRAACTHHLAAGSAVCARAITQRGHLLLLLARAAALPQRYGLHTESRKGPRRSKTPETGKPMQMQQEKETQKAKKSQEAKR